MRKLFGNRRSRKQPDHKSKREGKWNGKRKSNRQRLSYNPLERREMLATFVVNTASDLPNVNDGLLSLREALIAANANAAIGDAQAGDATGDVIWFDPDIAGSTINLVQGQLPITDDVVIQGGENDITLAGASNLRIFTEATSERVVISRLNFTNGRAGRGGAIQTSNGGLTLISGSTFDNNEAIAEGGGAIYHVDGTLNLVDTVFTNNSASAAQGAGGALYFENGRANVINSDFFENSANGGGGAIEIDRGVFYSIGMDVGEEDRGNQAGETDVRPANGGGMRISGLAFVSITGGTFNENTAAREGGAIWNGPESRLFVRSGALISENVASGNLFVENGGGGIYNSGGTVYVTNARINMNRANGNNSSGGGIFSSGGTLRMTNATVDENSATKSGGGVVVDGGFSLVRNSNISNNDAGITLTADEATGGGMQLLNSAIVVLERSEVSRNRSNGFGGGIWAHRESQLFVRDAATISDNQAISFRSFGGNVYTEGYLRSVGSFFLRGDAQAFGGGLYLTDTAFARISGSNFSGNTANFQGGGIFNDGFARITDSSFVGNAVGEEGGPVFTTEDGTSVFFNNSFTNNQPNNQV